MKVPVTFYSYFKELTGTPETVVELEEGGDIAALVRELHAAFPKLKQMDRSTLIAVGVEYQCRDYKLKPGEEVALFPPVQGG